LAPLQELGQRGPWALIDRRWTTTYQRAVGRAIDEHVKHKLKVFGDEIARRDRGA
jgi:hypothetical protein